MITPADHARLLSLTTLAVLTPEDATFIQHCMPSNSWKDGHEISWRYPVSDTGAGIPESAKFVHPIRKVSKGGCQSNPSSLSSQAPWIAAGQSRSYWYAQRAQATIEANILAGLPASLRTDTKGGLKLYSALAALADTHKLDIKELWKRVCQVLEG